MFGYQPQAINAAAINAALVGATLSANNHTAGTTGWIGWSSRAMFRSPSDGEFSFRNFAETTQASLVVEANDILAQRRGTNQQTLRNYLSYTDASNYGRLSLSWSGNFAVFAIENLGTGTASDIRLQATGGTSIDVQSSGINMYRNGTSNSTLFNLSGTSLTSTAQLFVRLTPAINQVSGTYTVLDINPTETAIGAGPHYLIRGRIGAGGDVFNVSNAGNTLTGPQLRIGGSGASNVLLKNSGSQLLLRDGTDSSYLGLTLRVSQLQAHTVASLPSASTWNGGITFVDNLTSTTRGSTATGGGALKGIVWSDGTNWIVM